MPAYRLSLSAETDIIEILAFTELRFGDHAKRRYESLIISAMSDIAVDPERVDSRPRPEIAASIRTYHLRHSRVRARSAAGTVHRPRHIMLYRTVRPDLIGIGRILHDGMDLLRHLPIEFGDE
jgi:toxin ParE1/3/4